MCFVEFSSTTTSLFVNLFDDAFATASAMQCRTMWRWMMVKMWMEEVVVHLRYHKSVCLGGWEKPRKPQSAVDRPAENPTGELPNTKQQGKQ
jgi:hypothetical protein